MERRLSERFLVLHNTKMATAKRKLTLMEKLNICERMARGATVTLLSKEYDVGKSILSVIKSN